MTKSMGLRLSVFFLAASLQAAAPEELHYQGKLTDAAGNPSAGPANLVFEIHTDAVADAAVFRDVRSGTPVENGVFEVAIGSDPATIVLGTVRGALQGGADRWLQISVDGNALTPREKIRS